ncbi:hypothetical protein D3C81_1586380 [compost metagenome]
MLILAAARVNHEQVVLAHVECAGGDIVVKGLQVRCPIARPAPDASRTFASRVMWNVVVVRQTLFSQEIQRVATQPLFVASDPQHVHHRHLRNRDLRTTWLLGSNKDVRWILPTERVHQTHILLSATWLGREERKEEHAVVG